MFTKDAFMAGYFLLSVVVIIFLAFQIQANYNSTLEVHSLGQKEMMEAARCVVKSATQTHPLLGYEDALRAQFLFEMVTNQFGGVLATERILATPKGELHKTKEQIELQLRTVQDYLMERFIAISPNLDIDLNKAAGMEVRKKTKKTK